MILWLVYWDSLLSVVHGSQDLPLKGSSPTHCPCCLCINNVQFWPLRSFHSRKAALLGYVHQMHLSFIFTVKSNSHHGQDNAGAWSICSLLGVLITSQFGIIGHNGHFEKNEFIVLYFLKSLWICISKQIQKKLRFDNHAKNNFKNDFVSSLPMPPNTVTSFSTIDKKMKGWLYQALN